MMAAQWYLSCCTSCRQHIGVDLFRDVFYLCFVYVVFLDLFWFELTWLVFPNIVVSALDWSVNFVGRVVALLCLNCR